MFMLKAGHGNGHNNLKCFYLSVTLKLWDKHVIGPYFLLKLELCMTFDLDLQ